MQATAGTFGDIYAGSCSLREFDGSGNSFWVTEATEFFGSCSGVVFITISGLGVSYEFLESCIRSMYKKSCLYYSFLVSFKKQEIFLKDISENDFKQK